MRENFLATSCTKELTKPSSEMSPTWLNTCALGFIWTIASRVSASDFTLRSVIAILEQPDRAKPLATAAPMPECVRTYRVKSLGGR